MAFKKNTPAKKNIPQKQPWVVRSVDFGSKNTSLKLFAQRLEKALNDMAGTTAQFSMNFVEGRGVVIVGLNPPEVPEQDHPIGAALAALFGGGGGPQMPQMSPISHRVLSAALSTANSPMTPRGEIDKKVAIREALTTATRGMDNEQLRLVLQDLTKLEDSHNEMHTQDSAHNKMCTLPAVLHLTNEFLNERIRNNLQ